MSFLFGEFYSKLVHPDTIPLYLMMMHVLALQKRFFVHGISTQKRIFVDFFIFPNLPSQLKSMHTSSAITSLNTDIILNSFFKFVCLQVVGLINRTNLLKCNSWRSADMQFAQQSCRVDKKDKGRVLPLLLEILSQPLADIYFLCVFTWLDVLFNSDCQNNKQKYF